MNQKYKKRRTKTKRRTYIGIVDKYSKGSSEYEDTTIFINNIQSLDGSDVTVFGSHAWFVVGKHFESINVLPGDTVQFEASIKSYIHKNYRNRNHGSYKKKKLAWPTKVKKV